MILVDDRVGSREFVGKFPNVDSMALRLDFADFSFVGNGSSNSNIFIGIERKTVNDLINSIQSGRLSAHQLPGMVENYQKVYLLIEGLWRLEHGKVVPTSQGKVYGPGMSEKGMRNYLTTIQEFSNVRLLFTKNMTDTANCVSYLYHYWQKPYESHSAHIQLKSFRENVIVDFHKPKLITRIAGQLPGLGAKKARNVYPSIKTVRQMAMADEKVWQSVPGIGSNLAKRLVKIIAEGED